MILDLKVQHLLRIFIFPDISVLKSLAAALNAFAGGIRVHVQTPKSFSTWLKFIFVAKLMQNTKVSTGKRAFAIWNVL